MKKIVTLVSCFAISLSVFSQSDNTTNNNNVASPAKQSVFSVGVHGGFGHSYITTNNHSRFHPSWDAGVAAIYAPWANWGLELGVRYSVEGTKNNSSLTNTDYTTELRYIRIPLKAVYFVGPYENDFRPKFSIGPVIGFLQDETNGIGAKAVDFGATVSAGFHYRLAKAIWFTTDVKFYQGFIDIYPQTANNDLNGNIRLDLGLNFGF
ncbi:MAG: outer membrane beta-barrel protein [Bacteroidia bacterium]